MSGFAGYRSLVLVASAAFALAARPARAGDADAAEGSGPRASPAPLDRTVEVNLAGGLAIAVPPSGESDEKSLLVPGLITGGIGLALAAAGAGLLGAAAGKAAEIRELCGEDAQPPTCNGTAEEAMAATELSEEGRAFEISGGVLIALGGGLLISMAATLIGDAERSEAPVKAAVLPILGPTEVGCSIVGTF